MARVALHLAALDDADAAELARCTRMIGADERARAARFRFDRDRRRFILRRARLRLILAAAMGGAAERLVFTEGAFGKPELPGGPAFSLSHSDDRMLVALGETDAERDLGCDLEAIDATLDWRPLADRLFAPEERAALAALPAAKARAGFFACWARKEAFVKAIGQGLSYPLGAFAVSVGPAARLLRGGDGWRIVAVDVCPGFAAAVVVPADAAGLAVRTADNAVIWGCCFSSAVIAAA